MPVAHYFAFHIISRLGREASSLILLRRLFFIGGIVGAIKSISPGVHFTKFTIAPQRLEVITSFYKHPQEMIVNSIFGSLIVYTLLGLSLEAGAFYTFFTAIGEFFYHTNVKTPRWVGYVFQRPEMHRIHHQYDRHKNNYGDFVWWDMLFGTYENPKDWVHTCGFDDAKEQKLIAMLKFQDVHKSEE